MVLPKSHQRSVSSGARSAARQSPDREVRRWPPRRRPITGRPWQDGLRYGQPVTARPGRGLGVDVPARAEPETHRCPRARPARRRRIPTGYRPPPGPGGLDAGHQAVAAPSPYPSPKVSPAWTWSSPGSRQRPSPPDDHSGQTGKRSMARRLAGRRREAAEGPLDPTYRVVLAHCEVHPTDVQPGHDHPKTLQVPVAKASTGWRNSVRSCHGCLDGSSWAPTSAARPRRRACPP
jgi:hypothetical protein